MEKNASGIPIEQAATELGVPADALRLYVSAHRLSDPASASIAQAQVSDLKEELRSRAGALRLDDLSKTALTIEWLAAAAGETARATDRLETTVAELGKRVSDKKGEDLAAKLDPIGKRIDALEAHSSEASGAAVQLVGSIQGMVESQGRELDALRADVSNLRSDVATLRSDIASLRLAVHGAEAKHQALLTGLRSAIQGDPPEPAAKAKSAAAPSTSAPRTEPPRPTAARNGAGDDIGSAPGSGESVENVPVTTPAKYRVKREIEYNFLLERMGFRRLDSYSANERADDLPSDEEIAHFLAKFELGCDPEEVEMVSVQRGEYHMVQYQRVDKASGIRSWISRGRT